MMGVSCLIPRQSHQDEAHVRKSKAIFIVRLRRPFFSVFFFYFFKTEKMTFLKVTILTVGKVRLDLGLYSDLSRVK